MAPKSTDTYWFLCFKDTYWFLCFKDGSMDVTRQPKVHDIMRATSIFTDTFALVKSKWLMPAEGMRVQDYV